MVGLHRSNEVSRDEQEKIEDLFRLILERHGEEGLIRSAALTVQQYAGLCGYGIHRGQCLFVVEPGEDDQDAP